MHGMIQNMAINIMNNSSPAKVMEITMDEEDWSSDLHMVFLKDFGGVIRDNMSPNCPKLSVLLMKDDYGLQKIPECFFMHLVQLKVLNLTNSNIEELPGSISELIHLRALVLRSCSKLSRMPSVVKMRSLKKLDLSLCKNLQAVPDGLENLVDLRYLDICWTKIYGLCDGLRHRLVKIQYLGFNLINGGVSLSVLERLERLRCSFSDVNELYLFAESNPHLPSHYDLFIGVKETTYYTDDDDDRFKIWSENISRCGKVIRIHGREDYEIRGSEDIHLLAVEGRGGVRLVALYIFFFGRILALYISSEGTDSRQLLEIKVALHRIS
ncbi:hypothetical protein CDL15_Pgr002479 [Punica granatum]|uniref:Disease resistance R13L4/SHOC-2-like LRR domain-containing protein n=1 Tax=Punica granatum TaxID=22663 RepID=A0A218XWP7_PUNGR|nr:hypothetical protein CDL15_Pgr002479 [Punica granatum]